MLLFDCQTSFRGVFPEGEFLSAKEQDELTHKVEGHLNQIHPRPLMGTNVEVSYVPVLRNPLEHSHP